MSDRPTASRSPRTADVTGVLLAAGAGSRFGQPKVLAEDGRWARAAVASLRDGGCDRVVVVLGAAPDAVVEGADPVWAPDWEQGLSRSAAAGLAGTDGDVVFTVVDTPDVSAACVRRVLDGGRGAAIGQARAGYGGRPGHPVFVAMRHRDAILAALRAATGAAIDRGVGPHLDRAAKIIECGDLATGVDIDHPAGLRVGGQ